MCSDLIIYNLDETKFFQRRKCAHCKKEIKIENVSFIFLNKPTTGENNLILKFIKCPHCGDFLVFLASIWFPVDGSCPIKTADIKRLYPEEECPYPEPSECMPESVKNYYEEARKVSMVSKRAATALLRVACEKFVRDLAETKEKISLNSAIEMLYSQNKISETVYNFLKSIKFFGNEASHPDNLDEYFEDNKITMDKLFEIVNIIHRRQNEDIESKNIHNFTKAEEGKQKQQKTVAQ